MKVKVCGITSIEQMSEVKEAGADFAGIIFYEHSKRYIGEKLKNYKSEIKNIDIKKIGVFVNADIESIGKAIDDYHLYAVQLHGEEKPGFCSLLKSKAKVIKVFAVDEKKIEGELKSYEESCDYFLFDTKTKHYGGSGQQFDWDILKNIIINKAFFLSGGINMEDVDTIKKFNHPQLFAIDINSCFEIRPGIKDIQLVQKFINSLHHE